MWKLDEMVRSAVSGRDATGQPAPRVPAVAGDLAVHPPAIGAQGHREKDVVNLGKSVVIKGELSGSEDLTVEGTVEGKVELRDHVLTIGSHGRIKAEVFARVAVVFGAVVGNITATEKVDIRDNGSVEGNIVSPRVAMAEGSHFRGSVQMQQTPTVTPPRAVRSEVKLAPLPAASQGAGGQRLVGA